TGGIREIEFTGQLFQLIRGGREPRLRERGLVATLEATAALGLLDDDAVHTLLTAYRFLRTTEHRLQQVRDRQTHSLPSEPLERARIAYACGHADWAAFSAVLGAQRAATHALFAGLLERPEEAADGAPAGDDWQALW